MFDLEKFKTGEYYVHLPTQELYDDVMEFLDENGFKWVSGRSLTNSDRWYEYQEQTCIRMKSRSQSSFFDSTTQCLLYDSLDYYKENGYKRLEINKVVKGEINMNEKMKRDLIKLLFEKEFYEHEQEEMYIYKGRIIMNYMHRTKGFIDFIEMINENYNIKGHEVAEIIIEEFDLKEYKG